MHGIRTFDISGVKRGRLVTRVQTCRGSHTVVLQMGDDRKVDVCVSGTAAVRAADEVSVLSGRRRQHPNSLRLRVEVMKVSLRQPWAPIDSSRA